MSGERRRRRSASAESAHRSLASATTAPAGGTLAVRRGGHWESRRATGQSQIPASAPLENMDEVTPKTPQRHLRSPHDFITPLEEGGGAISSEEMTPSEASSIAAPLGSSCCQNIPDVDEAPQTRPPSSTTAM